RDGVLVILAHEDDRQLLNRGKIQPFMEVPLIAGSFTEGDEGYELLPIHLRRKSETDGMRHLGSNRTGARYDLQPFMAEVCRHLPSAAVWILGFGEGLEHQLPHRHAEGEYERIIAVIRQKIVHARLQG